MSKPRLNEQTTRLTETLPELKRRPDCCGICGRTHDNPDVKRLIHWQESDHNDQPEPRWLVLCNECSDHVIEPHPRLYYRCNENAPMPGVMHLCANCIHRRGWKCSLAKANGGPGILVTASQPTTAFFDGRGKDGRRTGWRETIYALPPTACSGRK
jgi:hypothetical protein